MNTLDALLAGIVAESLEETRWLVLVDYLEEHDDPLPSCGPAAGGSHRGRAELLRLHRKLLATCCEPDAHPERAAWQRRVVELLGAGVSPCVPRHTLALPGGVSLVGAFVPPVAPLFLAAAVWPWPPDCISARVKVCDSWPPVCPRL